MADKRLNLVLEIIKDIDKKTESLKAVERLVAIAQVSSSLLLYCLDNLNHTTITKDNFIKAYNQAINKNQIQLLPLNSIIPVQSDTEHN